jgi:hypothetical protein
VARLYDDLRVLIEGDEDAQKALHAAQKSQFGLPQRLKPFLKAAFSAALEALLHPEANLRHEWNSCPSRSYSGG